METAINVKLSNYHIETEASTLEVTTFIITAFCLIDDQLAGKRLHRRGPQPTLRDSEVLTIEGLGEFLGLETDSIFSYTFAGNTRIGSRIYAKSIARPLCAR